MMATPMDQFDNVEEKLHNMISENDEGFLETLSLITDMRKLKEFQDDAKNIAEGIDFPITHLILQTKKSVYDVIFSILIAQTVIDQEYRLSMIHDLAERGSTFAMVPSTPFTEKIQMTTWLEIYRAFYDNV